MTPEERSAHLFAMLFDVGLRDEAALTVISDTIRSAEREAYERAAKVAEADTSFQMLQDFGLQSACAQTGANIAQSIRALADDTKVGE